MGTFNDLLDLAHSVGKYCIGMEGNVSKRLSLMEAIKIKASGAKLNTLTEEETLIILKDGRQYDNEHLKPSMESEFHKVIYELCPEVNFIAHTHPINTLKILCGDANLLFDFETRRLYPEHVIFNGPSSIGIGYHTPGQKLSKAIENEILHYIYNRKQIPKLILLMNHGIIALGKTVAECIAITETCEKAAEVFLGALSTGKIRYLSETSVQELLDDEKEKYRQSLIIN